MFGVVLGHVQRYLATLAPARALLVVAVARPAHGAASLALVAAQVALAAALLMLVAVGALGARAAGADPVPLPSGAAELPGATRQDVVRALRKVHHRYGEDAVLIETQLLINAMRSGSLRTTAVSVDGVKQDRDKRYLGFVVETGLVFDSQTRDETARVRMLWATIMVPTLERLTDLHLPADGIKVAMRYHHRPYRSQDDLRASIDRPGTPEETAFYVLAPDVDALVVRAVTAPNLIGRARVTVDGEERAMQASGEDPPTTPGPN